MKIAWELINNVPYKAGEEKMEILSEKIIKEIEKEMYYWGIPGVSIAVIKDGKLLESMGLGYRNAENKLGVTPDTQFGIASCSKSMTSALIAILRDKGVLDYDEPVTSYAPKLVMYDAAAEEMTLRDMLSHKTGFGAHDAIWPGDEKRDALAGRLRFIRPCAEFRGEAIYSNVMYAMAGYAAECATGESWDELVHKYIFRPLNMTRTNCSADIMKRDLNYSLPYRHLKGACRPIELWNVDLAGPAASVNSTANDMARWLMMHIAGGKAQDGTVLIQPDTFKEMHSPQSKLEDSVGFFACEDYSMGWHTGSYKGHALRKHTGKIEGYSSIQAFLPDEGVGAVILTNFHSPTVPFMYGSLYTVLDRLLGEEPENWFEKFHGEELPGEEAYMDCHVNYFKEEQAEGTLPSLTLSGYTGIYADNGYGTVNIVFEDGVLYMRYRDMKLPLEHYHYDVFRADDIREDILNISAPVSFTVNDGIAEAVAVRFEPMVPDIVFKRVR